MEIKTGLQLGHTGGEICHFKLINFGYLTIIWLERTEHSSPTQHFGDWCSHTRGS